MQFVWIVGISTFIVFLAFQASGIYAGDSGDLVTAAFTFGVPHPSGYPLYTFLGWLLTRTDEMTVAWHMALLSSVPQAITLALITWLTHRFTKSIGASIFTALLLLGNYVFFLYGVIHEVYALSNLFLVLISVMLLLFQETKKRKWLYWSSFVFGLGLSHHHVVLFLPIVIFVWWFFAKSWARFPRIAMGTVVRCIGLTVLGLVPYLYVWVAARGTSIINWDHVTTVDRFIRLFMLTDYGSYKANVGVGEFPAERLLGIKAYWQFLLNDFSIPGIVLLVAGLIYLYRRRPSSFWFFVSAMVTFGPLLFFYASFPLASRFTLGSFEQFLLFSYTLIIFVAGVGFFGIIRWISSLKTVFHRKLTPQVCTLTGRGVGIVLYAYPIILFVLTIYRFWGFSGDLTAQNLGEDVLRSVAPKSIIFLSGDTTLFTTQYVRYVLGRRTDVVVLQASRIGTPEYADTMKRAFPFLTYPQKTGISYIKEFVALQKDQYNIYSNAPFAFDSQHFWVPAGLLYRLTGASDLPALSKLEEDNDLLWRSYQKPQSGILSRFNHLFLSDVREVYAQAKVSYGKTLLKGGHAEHARTVLTEATSFQSETYTDDAYLFIGVSNIMLNRCQEALDSIDEARKYEGDSDSLISYYEALTWRDCFKDPKRAESAFSEYERLKRAGEQQLEAL